MTSCAAGSVISPCSQSLPYWQYEIASIHTHAPIDRVRRQFRAFWGDDGLGANSAWNRSG
jgi:hypothetical protein